MDKKPSDAAMRAAHKLSDSMGVSVTPPPLDMARIIDDAFEPMLAEKLASAGPIMVELFQVRVIPPIQPGDVVTLPSGSERWTVVYFHEPPVGGGKGGVNAEIVREDPERRDGHWFHYAQVPVQCLRKVEPEPTTAPAPDVDAVTPEPPVPLRGPMRSIAGAAHDIASAFGIHEDDQNTLCSMIESTHPPALNAETREALRVVVTIILNSTPKKISEHTETLLRRWLEEQRSH